MKVFVDNTTEPLLGRTETKKKMMKKLTKFITKKIKYNPLLYIRHYKLIRNLPKEFYSASTYKCFDIHKGVVDSYDSSITYIGDPAIYIKDSTNKMGIAIRPRKGQWKILSNDYFFDYGDASEYMFGIMVEKRMIHKDEIQKYLKYKRDLHLFKKERPHLFV